MRGTTGGAPTLASRPRRDRKRVLPGPRSAEARGEVWRTLRPGDRMEVAAPDGRTVTLTGTKGLGGFELAIDAPDSVATILPRRATDRACLDFGRDGLAALEVRKRRGQYRLGVDAPVTIAIRPAGRLPEGHPLPATRLRLPGREGG